MVNTDDCWLYAGTKDKAGYGLQTSDNITSLVHRTMYLATRGDIPPELEVDHLCNVRSCINPEHLQLLTHAQNMRKGVKNNHCNKGHELTDDNITTWMRGGTLHRKCKRCDAARSKAKYAARKRQPAPSISSYK